MNFAMFTHDLALHNTRLMPWRTVLEVAAAIDQSEEHSAVVLSGSKDTQCRDCEIEGVPVCHVPKPCGRAEIQSIADICLEKRIEVLYCPLAWRLPLTNIHWIEGKANLRIVWYMPGAWYHFRHVCRAVSALGLKATLPYLYQSLIPRKLYVKKLLKTGVRPLITMTEYNRDKLIRCGYPAERLYAIPPGKTPVTTEITEGSNVWEKVASRLDGIPYFLFFGPPQAIRGVQHILKAFKYVMQKNDDIALVCLFRSDKGLDSDLWQNKIKKLGFPENRFFCTWESLSGSDLHKFISNCHAVLKPFLLVPSEIPLAVIEAAGYSKPVIGTGPDGTGCFVQKFGMMVRPADSMSLAGAMIKLAEARQLYNELYQSAREVYRDHPTWNEVADRWLEVGLSAMSSVARCSRAV